MLKLVNIGCGGVYHSDWINLDKLPRSEHIQNYDISRPLPLEADSVDACYSSHVLEHLTPEQAKKFVADCERVLKPEGIIRLVVPDLEAIVKVYLQCLAEASTQNILAEANYDWILLELFDQMLRSQPGGQMKNFLNQSPLLNKDFIGDRLGQEAAGFWQEKTPPPSLYTRLRLKGWSWLIQKSRLLIAEALVGLIAGSQARLALKTGLFRQSGEIHQWMYDRFSLTRLLETQGFEAVEICSAWQSAIPNFPDYQLDTIGAQVRKPDSLFIEARKKTPLPART